jgi:hypothetical protein
MDVSSISKKKGPPEKLNDQLREAVEEKVGAGRSGTFAVKVKVNIRAQQYLKVRYTRQIPCLAFVA